MVIEDGSTSGAAMWIGRPKLILASSSPRRRILLERVEALAEVRPPDSAEVVAGGSNPAERAVRLSRTKAESVAKDFSKGIVLGADTLVVLDGDALGKPASASEAKGMLRRLGGRTHRVVTGITLIDAETGRALSALAETRVTFRSISEAEIEAYVGTGEPLDKAGAYGAQGYGGMFVESVDGCFYNVVGLPLALLVRTLDALTSPAGSQGA